MLCAGAGNPAGKDLTALSGELAETTGILVIDVFDFILAEHADFLSSAVVLAETALTLSSFVSVHFLLLICGKFSRLRRGVPLAANQKGRLSSSVTSSNLEAPALLKLGVPRFSERIGEPASSWGLLSTKPTSSATTSVI